MDSWLYAHEMNCEREAAQKRIQDRLLETPWVTDLKNRVPEEWTTMGIRVALDTGRLTLPAGWSVVRGAQKAAVDIVDQTGTCRVSLLATLHAYDETEVRPRD